MEAVTPVFSQFKWFALSQLGTFLILTAQVSASAWSFSGDDSEPFAAPEEVEVIAEAPPETFSSSSTTVVAMVQPPGGFPSPSGATLLVGLRDGGHSTMGAGIAKGGFHALQASVSFSFYTTTPHRNGNLFVRLLNREKQVLASFQLLAKEQASGELSLHPQGRPELRQMPDVHDLYSGKVWTPVRLDYDGAGLLWKLSIGTQEFKELPVDASIVDTAMERVEIHTGYGSSSKTVLYLDQITIKTTQR